MKLYTDEEIYKAIRTMNPRLRRRNVVGITKNTGRTRVYECCHCGADISMCNDYPVTKRVLNFLDWHNHHCGQELADKVLNP